MTPRERVKETLVRRDCCTRCTLDNDCLESLTNCITDLVEKLIREQQEYFASVQRRKSSFD